MALMVIILSGPCSICFGRRDEVKIVADQRGSPTLAGDLADVILQVITRETPQYGTFHFTNEGRTNWLEFASLIYERARDYHLIDRDVQLLPITTDQYPTKALRPANSHLSKVKITKVYGVQIRFWQETLDSFMAGMVDKAI